jgi:hypothetical protein
MLAGPLKPGFLRNSDVSFTADAMEVPTPDAAAESQAAR